MARGRLRRKLQVQAEYCSPCFSLAWESAWQMAKPSSGLSQKQRAFFSTMVSACRVAISADLHPHQRSQEVGLEPKERPERQQSRALEVAKKLEEQAAELPEPGSKDLEPKERA